MEIIMIIIIAMMLKQRLKVSIKNTIKTLKVSIFYNLAFHGNGRACSKTKNLKT